MELFRLIGVTGLPDNVHIQQKYWLFLKGNILFYFTNNPAYCCMGKRASDSSLSKNTGGL